MDCLCLGFGLGFEAYLGSGLGGERNQGLGFKMLGIGFWAECLSEQCR